jgi:hypothetical protein
MFFERFEDTVRESLEKVFGLILRFIKPAIKHVHYAA